MAFSSKKGPWSSIIQERCAYRPDYLGACCQPVWLTKGCVGRNAWIHVQMWFLFQASFFRTWLQWAVRCHQRKAAECGLQRASCFGHVSDVCNNDQVFVTIFHLTPLPLGLIVFSSTHGFPLATAQVVTNSNIFTERKRNWREEGPQELHGWSENNRP